MPAPIIDVQNVTKRFGNVLAVDGCSLKVEKGSLDALEVPDPHRPVVGPLARLQHKSGGRNLDPGGRRQKVRPLLQSFHLKQTLRADLPLVRR